jgi:GntR family transcriptional regulator, negative regulator for fad regulon and positive regulator of fabA
MDWDPPRKPAELAESRLIEAILDGHFAIGSSLPAERELAGLLGVTRPTLREALQRLARDGWLEIHQGRPTRVRDYWQEGSLAVLGTVVEHASHLPQDFVPNLLYVRQLLAPAYTRLAVLKQPEKVQELLASYPALPDSPPAYASADWQLHHHLTIASGNPVFTLILNGFCDFYQTMASIYFQDPAARSHSQHFYLQLLEAAQAGDPDRAEAMTRQVMSDSLSIWNQLARRPD